MHRVRFVDDDALPEGHDFVFVTIGEQQVGFLRRSAVSEQLITDAWAALRATHEPVPEPAPTRPRLQLVS